MFLLYPAIYRRVNFKTVNHWTLALVFKKLLAKFSSVYALEELRIRLKTFGSLCVLSWSKIYSVFFNIIYIVKVCKFYHILCNSFIFPPPSSPPCPSRRTQFCAIVHRSLGTWIIKPCPLFRILLLLLVEPFPSTSLIGRYPAAYFPLVPSHKQRK